MKVYDHEFGRIMERKWACLCVFMFRKRFGEDLNEDAGRKEAVAYSMFINNLIFVVGCH